jgi:hypothetical protein
LIPESSDLERLADEVADLWQRRAIVLEPARSA